jgi:hypothetical protein
MCIAKAAAHKYKYLGFLVSVYQVAKTYLQGHVSERDRDYARNGIHYTSKHTHTRLHLGDK